MKNHFEKKENAEKSRRGKRLLSFYKITGVVAFFFLLYLMISIIQSCKKKTSDTTNNDDEMAQALFDMTNLLDDAGTLFFDNAIQTEGKVTQSLLMTRDWLLTQPGVASADTANSTSLKIDLASGFTTYLDIYGMDEDGVTTTRGGDLSGSRLIKLSGSEKGCSNVITNKTVLIYAGAYSAFYKHNELATIISRFENNGFTVNVLKDEECTPGLIMTFPNYGLVILDTHGWITSFRSGLHMDLKPGSKPANEENFKKEFIGQLGQEIYDDILNKKCELRSNKILPFYDSLWWKNRYDTLKNIYYVWITNNYIDEIPELDSTIVYGNMCYSGYQAKYFGENPVGQAFLDRKTRTYYCYASYYQTSDYVQNSFCIQMEDSLTRGLVIDNDSTGNAHLKANGAEFHDPEKRHLFFRQFASPSWCYGGCGTFTDPRDGEKYQLACIGDQKWFAENLRYDPGGTYCYDNSNTSCDELGRLYPWHVAMNGDVSSDADPSGVQGVCPPGWHLPSDAEWKKLESYLGMPEDELDQIGDRGVEQMVGTMLKSTSELWNENTNQDNRDESGFSALPGGYYDGESYLEKGNWVHFWTCTNFLPPATDKAYFRALTIDDEGIYRSVATIYFGGELERSAYCRCVKD